MMPSNPIRAALRALLIAGTCALGLPSLATTTTDMSDLWWVPTESGWGIQLVQEELTIFATMFAYDQNGQPTWYTATMAYVPSLTWSGALYATTGPWFGHTPFDPTQVTRTPVGTMSLSAALINQATLTYTVNGVQEVKVIDRQSLAAMNFGGTYVGTLSQQGSGLPPCNPSRDIPGAAATFQISQNGGAMTITAQTGADSCTLTGTYAQSGHFGYNSGTYTCTSGDSGTFVTAEMALSWYDLRARMFLNSKTGCTLKGLVVGLKQPPPAQ
jgi:hypothetical protein